MLIDDKQLESLIWMPPSGRAWKVFAGELLVLSGASQGTALRVVNRLRDAMIVGLKKELVDLTGSFCVRCQRGETPKKKKTQYGLRVLHYDRSLKWQPCGADFIWLELMRDTVERKEVHGDKSTDAQELPEGLRLTGS